MSFEELRGKTFAIPLLSLSLAVKVGDEEPMTLFGGVPGDENVDGANLMGLSKADPA